VSRKCRSACRSADFSQQPTWPHDRQTRSPRHVAPWDMHDLQASMEGVARDAPRVRAKCSHRSSPSTRSNAQRTRRTFARSRGGARSRGRSRGSKEIVRPGRVRVVGRPSSFIRSPLRRPPIETAGNETDSPLHGIDHAEERINLPLVLLLLSPSVHARIAPRVNRIGPERRARLSAFTRRTTTRILLAPLPNRLRRGRPTPRRCEARTRRRLSGSWRDSATISIRRPDRRLKK